MGPTGVVACVLFLSTLSQAQGILAVDGWTGTIEVRANQSGTGTTVQAGAMQITENWTHDSSAAFTVTLAKDPTNPFRWTGTGQGPVSINNKNIMTMVAIPVPLTCTGTLFWIGTNPNLQVQVTLESDPGGLNYRLWITPNTIPAPNSGSVVCPYAALQFPTVDPNSPFAPDLSRENKLWPVGGVNDRLQGGLPYLGDSGIGGFVASPARVTYNVSWNLQARTAVTPPDPPEEPDCKSGGSIIGCLDQTLGEIIPVAGTPYYLRYQSNRTPGYAGALTDASSLGLGGWWLDPIQTYVPAKRTLFRGDGSSTLLTESPTPGEGGLFRVADKTATLNYLFNPAGRHLRTVDVRTGAVVLTVEYDAAGRLTKLTDTHGDATIIERSSDGRPTAIIAPYGHKTSLQTDGAGYLSGIAGPSGETYRPVHDAKGLLSSLTNPLGGRWSFLYNAEGRLISDTGASSQAATLDRQGTTQSFGVTLRKPGGLTTKYDSSATTGGRKLITTQSDGLTRTAESALLSSSMTFETGMKASFTYAANKLPVGAAYAPVAASVKTPAGLEWSARWSAQQSSTTTVETLNINGASTTSSYDSATRTREITTPAGRKIRYKLNEFGAGVESQEPGAPLLTTTYDERGRPTLIREQASDRDRSTTIKWNEAGLPVSLTTPTGQKFSWTYDASGRITEEKLPDGRTVGYGYDALDNVTSLTPPGRSPHTATYSTDGRILSRFEPSDSGPRESARYQYDAANRINRIVRPDSWSMDYAWNAAGKLEAITAGDAKLEYSYNRTTGTLSRIAGPGGAVVAFAWDGGLPISTEWLGPVQGKVSWRYDNYFRPVARQVNDQEEISYVYDADGLLTGSGAYTIFRDEQTGRPSTFELPGVTGGWIYAPGGELKDSAVSVLGSEIYSSHYERDEAGRITRKEENTGGTTTTWEYQYDAGGRLDTARVNGNLYANYRWDDNDNRTAEILSASTIGASFDPADRLIRRGNASYSYKPSGELSERDDAGVKTRLNIDPWGNLLSFASPDHNVTFIADPQGRRVAHAINGVVERAWVYEEGNRPAAELDADGNIISEFVYAGVSGPPVYMIRDGQIHLFVVDQLGSIRMLVNTETGEVAQQIDYDPFGKILQNTNPGFQPFGFAGGLHDPVTDLVRFGVRDYDPTVGRFISPDPRTFTGGSNHYVYCGGDPINLVDPLGTDPTSRASQLVNTGPAKQISQATQQAQQVVDVAKDASQLAGDPKSFLESKASKAVPEGAKSEYEKTLEENAKTAEESSSSFLKELEELYQKARKQLCGDDEEDQKKRQEEARKKQEQRAKDAASKKEVKSSSTSDPSRGPQPIPRPKTVVVKPPSLFR